MKKNNGILTIISMILVLVFSFMLAGCLDDTGNGNNDDEIDDNPTSTYYTITVNQATGGLIFVSKTSAQAGEEVTLSYVEDADYEFISYIVKDIDNNSVQVNSNKFTMPAKNVIVSGVFNLISGRYMIIVNQTLGGTIFTSNTSAQAGEEVTLSYIEDADYEFVSYSVKDANNNTIQVDNNKFVMPAKNVTVSGVFNAIIISKYTITINQPNGANISYQSNTQGEASDGFVQGTIITLTCTPDANYELVNWVVKDANNNNVVVTNNSFEMPNSNVTVTAVVRIVYNLTVDSTILSKCDIEIKDSRGNAITKAASGEIVSISCTAKPGYTFVCWNVYDGHNISINSTNTSEFFVVSSANIVISAEFNLISYIVRVGDFNREQINDFYFTRNNICIGYANVDDEITIVCVTTDHYAVKSFCIRTFEVDHEDNILYGQESQVTNNTFIMPANNVEVTAIIGAKERTLNITYLDDDETTVLDGLSPTTFKTTDAQVELPTPQKEGYRFDYWSNNGLATRKIIPNANSEDITLVAHWAKIYKITYILGDIEENITNDNPTEYCELDGLVSLSRPTQNGANFDGWWTQIGTEENDYNWGNDYYDLSSLEEDLTLYARWDYISYRLDFVLLGGGYINIPEPITIYYTILTDGIDFADHEAGKGGYTFDGWYTCDGTTSGYWGEKLTGIYRGTWGITCLYAKYDIATYTISYELYGGTNNPNNPSQYTYGDVIALEKASKPGYTFVGWYDTNEFINEYKYIKYNTYGNLMLYALFNLEDSDFVYANNRILGLTSSGKSKTMLVIPTAIEGVTITVIDEEAFKGATNLQSVTIPTSVTTIRADGFYGCTNLSEILFEDDVCGLLDIFNGAFAYCRSLQTFCVKDNSSLRYIGYRAFLGCSALTTVTLPKTVNYFGGGIFYQCDNLVTLEIENNPDLNWYYSSDRGNTWTAAYLQMVAKLKNSTNCIELFNDEHGYYFKRGLSA